MTAPSPAETITGDKLTCHAIGMDGDDDVESGEDSDELVKAQCNELRIERLGWSVPVALGTAVLAASAMAGRRRRTIETPRHYSP